MTKSDWMMAVLLLLQAVNTWLSKVIHNNTSE